MSRTTVYAIYPGEKIEEIAEYNNSWGSAPVIWSAIYDKYLKPPGELYQSWMGKEGEKLWAIADDEGYSQWLRNVLRMTFDRAIIKSENFQQAADDLETFFSNFPQPENHVNHWPKIVTLLRTGAEGAPAIGFHMTSVSENPFAPQWDEEKDERIYNWNLVDVYG